jgi:metallo-beta-lactamase family protein
MKITFYGATQQVTGSMFLLELDDDFKILIDCGTDLEKEKKNSVNEIDKSWGIFPFEPSLVNLVLLTHAHIDHSGQLPNLYREGFEGQVLCTSPTLELAELLLEDSASINLKKLKQIERSRKKSKKLKAVEGSELYLPKQVREAMENFVPIAFNHRFKIRENTYVTFIQAGHLLGAAHIVLEIRNPKDGSWKKIGFSGDIGRQNYPLLQNPSTMPEVDYLVMESTYGARNHVDTRGAVEILDEIIEEACVQVPGRLIIPTFSVGRTQALLFTLNKLFIENNKKTIKIFTDSPLAKATTKVYEKYIRLLNKEAREFHEENELLFDFDNLYFLQSNEASRAVSDHNEPCIIISSSGMIQGGRVEHHIEKNIGNPYATILMIGYASEGTLGYQLLNGERKDLTINGKKEPFLANIKKIDVFSGHGDLNDLLLFVKSQNKSLLKNIFLVHGEESSMINLKSKLNDEGFQHIEIPSYGKSFDL